MFHISVTCLDPGLISVATCDSIAIKFLSMCDSLLKSVFFFMFLFVMKEREPSAIVEDTKTMTVRVHFDAEVPQRKSK